MGDLQDFFEFIDVLEEEQQNEDELNAWRLPKRYIRDMQDPFDFYENSEFSRRFRIKKENVRNVLLPLVSDALEKATQKGLPVPPHLQLLIALRFYATGNFQVS